jgi:hypothetical protein
VLLARYLVELGFSGLQVGVLVTATLQGSAVLTLVAGLRLARLGARSVLLWSCGLMAATGVGFGTLSWFWPLLVVGFIATLNPSGGDVSLFLPTEQAAPQASRNVGTPRGLRAVQPVRRTCRRRRRARRVLTTRLRPDRRQDRSGQDDGLYAPSCEHLLTIRRTHVGLVSL